MGHVEAQYKFTWESHVREYPNIESYLEAWYTIRRAWVTARREARIAHLKAEVVAQEEEIDGISALVEMRMSADTSRVQMIEALVTSGMPPERAEVILRGMRAWNINTAGLNEARAELIKLKRALETYEAMTVDAIMHAELNELEPQLGKQLEEAEARNFAEGGKKRRKIG